MNHLRDEPSTWQLPALASDLKDAQPLGGPFVFFFAESQTPLGEKKRSSMWTCFKEQAMYVPRMSHVGNYILREVPDYEERIKNDFQIL